MFFDFSILEYCIAFQNPPNQYQYLACQPRYCNHRADPVDPSTLLQVRQLY